MYEYDNYTPEQTPAAESAEVVTDNTKVIISARSYISKNKEKLEKLSKTDTDESAKLRIKIQERVNILKALNAAIDDDTKAWLLEKGFTV